MKKINFIISIVLSKILIILPNQIIAIIYSLLIRERLSNGKDQFPFKNKSNRYSILALDSERYRGDIDILSKCSEFRVLHIRQGWQRLLMQVYLKGKNYIDEVENAPKGSLLEKKHQQTKTLINDVLAKLFKILEIDCITLVHFKYIPDHYWVKASENINVPCIMLYRECNVMSPIIYDMVVAMMIKQKSFIGSHVIVHNKKIKNAFIEANFIDENKITVASALRMDKYLNKKAKYLNAAKKQLELPKRRKFTLFYFPVNSSMFGSNNNSIKISDYYPNGSFWEEKERYFVQLHELILNLAHANRDVDFVIKPKENFMYEDSWKFYEKVVSESKVNIDKLDNYLVDPYADVHELIMESDILCGGQSTTSVEALFLGKQVILPLFCNYKNTEYFAQFPWKDYTDLFSLAENNLEFENHFYNALLKPLDSGMQNDSRRQELYLKCFDDLEAQATEIYSKTIIEIINQRRSG